MKKAQMDKHTENILNAFDFPKQFREACGNPKKTGAVIEQYIELRQDIISLHHEETFQSEIHKIEKDIQRIDNTLKVYGENFKKIDKKFDDIDRRFEDVDKRFTSLEVKISDYRFQTIIWMVGTMVSMSAIIIGSIKFL